MFRLRRKLSWQAITSPDPIERGRAIAKLMDLTENWLKSYLQDKFQDGYLIDSVLERSNEAFRTKHPNRHLDLP